MTKLDEIENKLISIKADKLISPDKSKKGKMGGVRPGAGRKSNKVTLIKKGVKEWFDQHMNEEKEVRMTDYKTGITTSIKKTRLMVVVEKLFEIGVKGEGNVDALKVWLAHMVGSPLTRIAGSQDEPIHFKVDIEYMLNKIYGEKE